MEFDAADFLASLFGDGVPAACPSGIDVLVQADRPMLVWIEPAEDAAPRPCPTCGGSDLWETIAGTWRCQWCDAAALEKSRAWADKAAGPRSTSARIIRRELQRKEQSQTALSNAKPSNGQEATQ